MVKHTEWNFPQNESYFGHWFELIGQSLDECGKKKKKERKIPIL